VQALFLVTDAGVVKTGRVDGAALRHRRGAKV
jgi:hypothetical protein